MICSRCQAPNREGVKFCEECRARLEIVCLLDENRSHLRKRSAPHATATLRNLAIGVLRLAGAGNIAAALRSCGRKLRTTLRLIGL